VIKLKIYKFANLCLSNVLGRNEWTQFCLSLWKGRRLVQESWWVCGPEGQLQGLLEIHEATLVLRDIRRQPKIQPRYAIRCLPLEPFFKLRSGKEVQRHLHLKRDNCRVLNFFSSGSVLL
jgi:hypothetical protein